MAETTEVAPNTSEPSSRRLVDALIESRCCVLLLHTAPTPYGYVLFQIGEHLNDALIISPTFHAADNWRTQSTFPQDLEHRQELVVFCSLQHLLTYWPLERLPKRCIIMVDDCARPTQIQRLQSLVTQEVVTHLFNYRPPLSAQTAIEFVRVAPEQRTASVRTHLQEGKQLVVATTAALPSAQSLANKDIIVTDNVKDKSQRDFEAVHIWSCNAEQLSNVRYTCGVVISAPERDGYGAPVLPKLYFYDSEAYAEFNRQLRAFNELLSQSSSLCGWRS